MSCGNGRPLRTPSSRRLKRHSTTTPHGGYGPMSSGSGSPGYAAVGGGGDQWVVPVQSNTTFYAVYEQCFANPCSSTSAFWLHHQLLRGRAGSGYALGKRSGELLDGGVVSGIQTVNATVSDSGGGARSIVIFVNGIPSASSDFCGPTSAAYYSHLKPCPDVVWPAGVAARYRTRSRVGERCERCSDLRLRRRWQSIVLYSTGLFRSITPVPHPGALPQRPRFWCRCRRSARRRASAHVERRSGSPGLAQGCRWQSGFWCDGMRLSDDRSARRRP